ncbi:Uncharacterised protein [Paucimonas lemoignei]|jgi:hypothetical protein|nr:Uncharacterised protein [Paucimonas lemoignei]
MAVAPRADWILLMIAAGSAVLVSMTTHGI